LCSSFGIELVDLKDLDTPEIRTDLRGSASRSDLSGATADVFEMLASQVEQRVLRRGDVLIRQGDLSDTLHFILAGRFTVHVDGTAEPIAELSQGEPVGEIGFFAGLPRTATVVALRDSTVLTITREQFQQISGASPALLEAIVASLARRLAGGRRALADNAPRIRTLAIVPAGDSRLSPAFVDMAREVFGSRSRATFLTRKELTDRFPGVSLQHPTVSHWLNALEAEADLVVYIGEQTLTDWTEKCLRQADMALLIAFADASTEVNPTERLAFSLLPSFGRRLVILHQSRSSIASGSASWLRGRDVFMHHHAALGDDADIRRLHRFITGNAAGFVAGAGGALGSAHLGVYKALAEAGAEFDILGGASVGAAMTAALACGADPERIDSGTHNIFVKSRALRRLTVPRYALVDHKTFDRALQAEFGAAAIEDLWIPFFAVSSNLSYFRPSVHRQGPVWQAVRASASIPGILPPFFTSEGEMLVDGALMDNVPLATMKQLKSGPNVIVSLEVDDRRTYPVDYGSIPGRGELAAALLNPFARGRLPKIPGILQVLMLSALANRRTDRPMSDRDILFRPEIPPNLGWTNWERHTELFNDAYRQAAAWIEGRRTDGDSGLLALFSDTPGVPASAGR
jgi:NTE family protein